MTDKPLPPEQRTDDDLVQLCLELYARTFAYPNNESMHNAAFEAIAVLKARLASLRASRAPVSGGVREAAQIAADAVYACLYNPEGMATPDSALGLIIKTLESNEFLARGNDWIIRGVKGEFYACKPDIFAATYESVAHPASRSVNAEAAAREILTEVYYGGLRIPLEQDLEEHVKFLAAIIRKHSDAGLGEEKK